MNPEEAFLQEMVARPSSALLVADWLEERGDPRGELLRLTHLLTQAVDPANRPALEDRLRALAAAGVRPVGPFWTNSVGMTFAWIPPGTFLMGCPEGEDGYNDEKPRHKVTLTRGFHLGIHPVTQAQWQAVMGVTPSRFKGDNLPVENVSRDDAVAFCERLGRKEGQPYRLPTEAEWEYACRAGTTTPFHFGATISTDLANYDGNNTYGNGEKVVYRNRTTPVGSFPANAWGLFDMHGNVCEWCAEGHGPYGNKGVIYLNRIYTVEPGVLRGGSWRSNALLCRAAFRGRPAPGNRLDNIGFRVALRLD